MLRLLLAAALLFILAGCAAKNVPPVAPHTAPERASFIDLQAGWRVSVVTPLLKSGKYLLESQKEPMEVTGTGNKLSVTMQADSDFLGYENSYYDVEARGPDGVRMRFTGAEIVQEGKVAPQKRPVVALFALPRDVRYVRLIFLLRASRADHNMAIVAVKKQADLNALTRALQDDPANGCRSSRGRWCQWVPAGIAVRPQVRRANGEWAPAR